MNMKSPPAFSRRAFFYLYIVHFIGIFRNIQAVLVTEGYIFLVVTFYVLAPQSDRASFGLGARYVVPVVRFKILYNNPSAVDGHFSAVVPPLCIAIFVHYVLSHGIYIVQYSIL